MGLPSIEHFDMIRLDCEDLKRGLAEAARGLADELLRKVSDDHRRENKRYNEDCAMFKHYLPSKFTLWDVYICFDLAQIQKCNDN